MGKKREAVREWLVPRLPAMRSRARRAMTVLPLVMLVTLFVLPIPAHASVFNVAEDINGWICHLILSGAERCFDIFNSLAQDVGSDSITGSLDTLLGTTAGSTGNSLWDLVKTVHSTLVIPVASGILTLFMLVQTIKISQRIDATGTLPALKEIVFLGVSFAIFSWLIVNSLDLLKQVFTIFNNFSGGFGAKDPTSSPLGSSVSFGLTDDQYKSADIGSCLVTLLCSVLSILTGILAYIVAKVVALARAVQLYVMAVFAPIPFALLGFDETRQMGVGFLKNFCAAALAGAIMMFLLIAYPYIVTSVTSGNAWGSDFMTSMAMFITDPAGSTVMVALEALLTWLATSILLILGLVKSGAWAREILGG